MKMTFLTLTRLSSRLLLLAVFSTMLTGLSSCNSPFSESDDPEVTVWKLPKNCDLSKGECSIQNGKQSVAIHISPNNPIPVAHLLDANVQLTGFDAQNVQIDITGINMYMGYNRTTLVPVKDKPNSYQGKIMLAFCTNEKMDWEISVLITRKDGHLVKIPFPLSTRSH